MSIQRLYSIVFSGLEISLSVSEMEQNYEKIMASATLPELEESVVNAIFADDKSPSATADKLGITVEQVNALEAKAIKRLQYHTRKDVLWPDFRNAKRADKDKLEQT